MTLTKLLPSACLWALALLLPAVTVTVSAQNGSFQEPQTETESKILAKLLERRHFTAAEAAAINQNGDVDQDGLPLIDVRDLALYYRANPKPPFAFFETGSVKIVNGVTGMDSAQIAVLFTKPMPAGSTLFFQITGDAASGADYLAAGTAPPESGIVRGSIPVTGTRGVISISARTRSFLSGSRTALISLLGFREAANAAERLALTALPEGFRVRQTDTNTLWRWARPTAGAALQWIADPGAGYEFGDASTCRVTIQDADLGLYRATLRFLNGSNFTPQLFTIGLRSGGLAVFDAGEAPLLRPADGSFFTIPGALDAKNLPHFDAGASSGAARAFSSNVLGRTVNWVLYVENQPMVDVASEPLRLALTPSATLYAGALVRQTNTNDPSFWMLADDRSPAAKPSWEPLPQPPADATQAAGRRLYYAARLCLQGLSGSTQDCNLRAVMEFTIREAPPAPDLTAP